MKFVGARAFFLIIKVGDYHDVYVLLTACICVLKMLGCALCTHSLGQSECGQKRLVSLRLSESKLLSTVV